MNFLKGKKTYITMAVLIILGGIDGYNQYCNGGVGCHVIQVPGFVFSILGVLGVYTRSVAGK